MANLNRRAWLGTVAVLAMAGSASAAELEVPIAFEELALAQTERPDGKTEVTEFFWYGCPHCYTLEPTMKKWLAEDKPETMAFNMEAPPLNPSWQVHSRAFYAAKQMGVLDAFHEPFFDAIHKDRKRLNDPDDIAAFADGLGIDGKKLKGTMSSFMVDGAMRNAMNLAAKYQLTGVPSVVVAGKYKTSGQLAGNYNNMVDAITELGVQLAKK
ncbi:MAG: thiol:disulfide interchange protein DsbA/DsbL [Granulosicoccaceae bacterium]